MTDAPTLDRIAFLFEKQAGGFPERAEFQEDKPAAEVRHTPSLEKTSAENFRAAARRVLSDGGHNEYLVGLAFDEELEKIASWGALGGKALSWLGSGLSRVGAKRFGGAAQVKGGKMLLDASQKALGAGSKTGLVGAQEARAVMGRSQTLKDKGIAAIRGGQKSYTEATKHHVGRGTVSGGRVADKTILKAREAKNILRANAPKVPKGPAQTPKGTRTGPAPSPTSGRTLKKVQRTVRTRGTPTTIPGLAVKTPKPVAPAPVVAPAPAAGAGAAPGAAQPGFLKRHFNIGGQQAPGAAQQGWWEGADALQRQKILAAGGGMGIFGTGVGATALSGGGNKTTVVYR